MEKFGLRRKFKPPKGTVPTIIYDIYGGSIVCYFAKGDSVSPKRLEKAIKDAQRER